MGGEGCEGSNVCIEESETVMYPNDKYARFTFNLPAERRYFADDTRGLRIKLERDTVFLQPSVEIDGDDIMVLATRTRGGRSTDLHADATAAKQIMRVFGRQGFTVAKPFFILQDNGDGWINLSHFPDDAAPPKTFPHLRIWPLHHDVIPTKSRRIVPFDMTAWRMACKMVPEAIQTLAEYDETRCLGRPTVAIRQAKAIMASFTRLVAKTARGNRLDGVCLIPKRRASAPVVRLEQVRRRA